jgi:hypothetical protein
MDVEFQSRGNGVINHAEEIVTDVVKKNKQIINNI